MSRYLAVLEAAEFGDQGLALLDRYWLTSASAEGSPPGSSARWKSP